MKYANITVGLLFTALSPVIGAQTAAAQQTAVEPACSALPGLGWSIEGTIYIVNGGRAWKDYPLVNGVFPNSAAERAGFQVGDVVLQQNGKDMREPVPMTVKLFAPGKHRFIVRRGKKEVELFATICAPPKK